MSFLWSVRREPAAYFFGTIHVPYTRVWDYIPDNAKQAFEASDNVFFELDLMDPGTISALASCQLLPKGQTLMDLLPKDIFSRLKRHLDYVKTVMPTWMTADQRGRGLYADYLFNAITGNWERKRPVWVMLMVNSLTESDIKSRGIPVLDLFLAQEAERANKRAGAVERVEEQCLPLNGLNFTQVVFALNLTLAQHESLRSGDGQLSSYTTDDLIRHYNCGDLDAVIFNRDTTQVPTLGISNGAGGTPPAVSSRLSTLWTTKNVNQLYQDQAEARIIDDYFRDELIYKRNKRMGQRVAQLLKAYPDQTFFFAFGAGHYLGNNTVLDFVQEEGYEIDQIPPNKRLRGAKRSKDTRKEFFGESVVVPSGRSGGQQSVEVRSSKNGNHSAATVFHLPLLLNRAGRIPYERMLEESSMKKPSLIVPLNRRFGLWKRRPSGHSSVGYHSTVHLVRTTSAPAKPAPRKFNDLWVRLESTREPYTSPQEGYLQDEGDSEVVKKSLRIWYGIPSSGNSPFRLDFLSGSVTCFINLCALAVARATLTSTS